MGHNNCPAREVELAQFQHTQLGVYLAGAFGLCYVWSSSAQGIVDRYHFSKKWFYLYGVLVAFAYLYMRPFVRRGLGSAHRGYLNFYSLYILWLCTALFCHLPSLEALGIDIKADISVALSITASSLLVLGVLHGLQAMLIHFKWLAPAPGATQQALWSCIFLNSITLAGACSTYFQLCGNGAAGPATTSSSSSQSTGLSAILHDAVCVKYLAPIATKEYPTFSAWMLYGERNTSTANTQAAAAALARKNTCGSSSSSSSWFGFGSSNISSCEPVMQAAANSSSSLVDFVMSVPAGGVDDGGSVISPVFTMWITLVTLYIINVLVDHVSASDMSARHISELRRERVKDPDLALLAALTQAAGETFRQGAHQLAAAQQQRHQQQQAVEPERGRQQVQRGGIGQKRSKSLEVTSSLRQPWSPRFVAERALVNVLETSSSFSFKAAALLEGIETKGFPSWQQLQSNTRLGSLSLGGLGTLGDRLGSIKGTGTIGRKHSRRQQQQQQEQQLQQLRRASTDGAEGVAREQQLKQQRQRRQQQPSDRNRLGGIGETERPARGLAHVRSKSLSSIQSAGTGSGREDDDLVIEPVANSQQQHQQQEEPVGPSRLSTSGRHGHINLREQEAQPSLDHWQQQQLPSAGTASTHSLNRQHLGSTRLSSSSGASQQQQQAVSRLSEHSTSSYCSSPFAASQPGVGFGSYGGFGSAVSLYSPGSEGHDSRPLEQLLASGAAEGGSTAAAAASRLGYSSSSSGGGVAPPPATASTHLAKSSNKAADATPPAAAQQAAADTAAAAGAAAPQAAAANWQTLNTASRAGTQESEWSDLTDEGFGDRSGSGVLLGHGSGYDGPAPPFLDMVPWYSGTSADLFKTMFDLMISVKLFLGRFDMRTMQAATAASMADSFNNTPSEGDGFTYEHYHNKEELWFDFIADTGDGGNSTYTVARALAAPSLTVPVNDIVKRAQQQEGQRPEQVLVTDTGATGQQRSSSSSASGQQLQLPRGDVLLIGGDLAYPNPSRDTYEQRLFVPFQEAMPPPPHYHPGRLVVHKPDLPPAFGVQEGLSASRTCPAGLSPRSSRYASVSALRSYSGPNVFAIPGNHDWIDGLETFIKHIMHKGWLGGWLMPQEKSYFALRLPAGWWVFGLDLALVGDIDMCQYRYFANVVERRVGPEDNVIIITHEPTWLLEWFWAASSSSNLRQLVRGHLRGRARVHLAGDLHFYMRHSYMSRKQQQQQQGTAGGPTSAQEAAVPVNPVAQSATTAGVAAAAEQKVAAADELLQMRSVSPTERVSSAVTWEQPMDDVVQGLSGFGAQSANGNTSGTTPAGVGQPHRPAGPGAIGEDMAVNGRHSRRVSSSSSSGVESCSTPPGQLAAHAAAAAPVTFTSRSPSPSTAASRRTSNSSSPGHVFNGYSYATHMPGTAADAASAAAASRSSKSRSRSPSEPDGGPSPVDRARQTLPRLVVGSPVSRHSSGDLGYRVSSSSKTGHRASRAAAPTGDAEQASRSAGTWAAQSDNLAAAGGPYGDRHPKPRGDINFLQQQELVHPSLLDPEHLIVNGMGGAFLHPTHVFSYSRFACLEDEAAAATAAIYSSAEDGANASFLSAVPMSSGSSDSSLTGHVHHTTHSSKATAARYPSQRHTSLAAWDPELLSWHCPMSPSGMSDIWDQQSLHGMSQINLGPAATAAPTAAANGVVSSRGHDPVPALGTNVGQPVAETGVYGNAISKDSTVAASAAGVGGSGVADAGASAGGGSAAAAGDAAAGSGAASSGVAGGVYKCAAAFPSAEKSLRLGRKNLHLFRFKNSRFDVIGGAIYFLSIVSTLPRCKAGLALLSATSFVDFLIAFATEFAATWYDIVMNSYLSLATAVLFFFICFGFAKGGGVGAVSGERQQLQSEQKKQHRMAQQQYQQKGLAGSHSVSAGATVCHGFKKPSRRSPVVGPLVKLRTGGSNTQLLVAVLHCGTHLSLAVVLLLLLELGVELCIKYERLGSDGLHSMYHWFEQYQDQHFPDPMGLRDMAHRWSLGLYPGVIKAAMAVYDIPEAVAVAKNAVCSAGSVAAGFAGLSRVQMLAYYAGMLAYYWLLAIPAMGFVFGLYLYVCVCWFHVHYDESFSALRIANFKGLTRLHITKEGDLEIYTLGIDRVPTSWREDSRWYSDQGGGSGKVAAHAAAYPSRWVPAVSTGRTSNTAVSAGSDKGLGSDDPSMGLRVVDYLKVPRQRPCLHAL